MVVASGSADGAQQQVFVFFRVGQCFFERTNSIVVGNYRNRLSDFTRRIRQLKNRASEVFSR